MSVEIQHVSLALAVPPDLSRIYTTAGRITPY